MAQSDSPRALHELFDAQAQRTPEGVALYDGTGSITFAELNAQAERIASALRARSIGAESIVGLHVERSIAWVAGVLGILKSNAAVMPLPPSYPAGRLRDILSHAAVDAVIDSAATRLDRSLTATVFDLEALRASADPSANATPSPADAPAFVLCSSGSTGTPKMIVRSHASFLHRLNWTWERHPYAAGEVCCQKAHATTTHAIYELFEPLLRGVPVVIIPDDDARDLERFWDTIRARNVTRLLIVPSALQATLDMPGFVPPPLDVVVLMGEYVNPQLAERAVTAFPVRTRLYSIYGSTEASSTLICDLRASFRAGTELPLGTPLSTDVRALVLGPNLEPVAPGETGRLHITGTALFSEYLRSPDLTASVFVTGTPYGDKLYDTHDQVRLTPDGSLQFAGRVDDTVKVRGFRVDLQEVERALLSHPGVRSAAVVVSSSPSSGNSLLGFVTPATVDPTAVYDTLRDRLPAYMLPSALTALDVFPLTTRGKLDRARLVAEPAHPAPAASPGRTASHTERRVAGIWAQVLGHDAPTFASSFFEVGGTSLTVFALLHRMRAAFALDRSQLPEQSVYRYPTVEKMAGHIDRIASGRTEAAERGTPVLVTMRHGSDPDRPPLFVIASAGGTLGAYEKLARALTTPREIIGVRDPFVWGERDLSEGFDRWVGRYVDAMRERQPRGPYYVCAYSSAGAFGYEIARRLRAAGEDVPILVLIDPLALDRRNRRRYGWWALRATYARPPLRTLVRLAGWLRVPMHGLSGLRRRATPAAAATPSDEEVRRLAAGATRDPEHLQAFAALLELNTGLPLALEPVDFAGAPPDRRLDVLQTRIAGLMPEVDPANIERIVVQYGFQVRAQHAYQLQPYDAPVLLIEPATRYAGLEGAHLRPYVRNLRTRAIPLGRPSERIGKIMERFGALQAHYRSMRDDEFVSALAREIDQALA
jgi:amino acid adenylation domain-containing protein